MKDSFIEEQDLQQTLDSLDKTKDVNLFTNDDNKVNNTNRNKYSLAGRSNLTYLSTIIGEVKYRWVIVICFFLLSLSNGLQWVCISSIAENFNKAYDVSHSYTNLFSSSYMIIFPFVFPLAAYIIDNKSCKLGVSRL